MYFKSSLAEIERRLGPVFRERGLRMCLEGTEERHLYFQRTDEDGLVWRSPLTFIFMDPERSKFRKASFATNSIVLGTGRSETHHIGTNGWVHIIGGPSSHFTEIGERGRFKTWDDAFTHAATVLFADPLVPKEFGLNGIVDSYWMFRFWEHLQEIAQERGIERIDVGRMDSETEFFHFEYEGSEFRIVFDVDSNERILKDGVDVTPKDAWEKIETRKALVAQLEEAKTGYPNR